MAITPLSQVVGYQTYYPWERNRYLECAYEIGFDLDNPGIREMLEEAFIVAGNLRNLAADTVRTICDPHAAGVYIRKPQVTENTINYFLHASGEESRRQTYQYGLCAMARAIQLHNQSKWDPIRWLEEEQPNILMMDEAERLPYLSLLFAISLFADKGMKMGDWQQSMGVQDEEDLLEHRRWDDAITEWHHALEPYLSMSEGNLVMV